VIGSPLAALIDTARALVALFRTSVLFRAGGRGAVARATREAGSPPGATLLLDPSQSATIWRVYRAVRRAKRIWPANAACLQTALVLVSVLHARGIPASIQVGVRRHGTELTAHAWVQAGDLMLDDAGAAGAFVALQTPERRDGLVPA
jgi:hypothetical protein